MLVLLVLTYGSGPFVRGVSSIDPAALLVALAVGGLTTVCCAWRWRLVARALGLDVPLGQAIAACYRSQLLNVTLPAGVLGDVHRAVDRGRRSGRMGASLRSVGWERGLGQVVQVAITALVVVSLPSPVRPSWQVGAVAGLLAVAVALALVGLLLPTPAATTLGQDLRGVLASRGTAVGVVLASAVVVLGHATVFLVAVRAAGTDVPATTALPLSLVVLLVAAVPMNLAGWGPREGAAAWVFGAAGLGATQGITASVVYGVLVLVATLPGALLLLVPPRRRAAARATREDALMAEARHG